MFKLGFSGKEKNQKLLLCVLREALHTLSFFIPCFCTCSSLNCLLRWTRGEVLCSVPWQSCTLFYCQMLNCYILGPWFLVAASDLWLMISFSWLMHSGPFVTVLYGCNPTQRLTRAFYCVMLVMYFCEEVSLRFCCLDLQSYSGFPVSYVCRERLVYFLDLTWGFLLIFCSINSCAKVVIKNIK